MDTKKITSRIMQGHIADRVARAVVARTIQVDEKDNLEREFKNALKNGDTVKFLYTKKDGTSKTREITPQAILKIRGRWAVKGVEVNDRRGVTKMFYLDMIGDAVTEQAEQTPSRQKSVQTPYDELKGAWRGGKKVPSDILSSKMSPHKLTKQGRDWNSGSVIAFDIPYSFDMNFKSGKLTAILSVRRHIKLDGLIEWTAHFKEGGSKTGKAKLSFNDDVVKVPGNGWGDLVDLREFSGGFFARLKKGVGFLFIEKRDMSAYMNAFKKEVDKLEKEVLQEVKRDIAAGKELEKEINNLSPERAEFVVSYIEKKGHRGQSVRFYAATYKAAMKEFDSIQRDRIELQDSESLAEGSSHIPDKFIAGIKKDFGSSMIAALIKEIDRNPSKGEFSLSRSGGNDLRGKGRSVSSMVSWGVNLRIKEEKSVSPYHSDILRIIKSDRVGKVIFYLTSHEVSSDGWLD